MTAFDEFLGRNREFAERHDLSSLTPLPSSGVFVVTCLDPRVEPAGFLGIQTGEALVLRNPGGRITDEAIADIALIAAIADFVGYRGPPLEIAVVHHTKCGMALLANERFRSELITRTGLDDSQQAARAVTNPAATVQHDVQRLRSAPLGTAGIVVSGHVLDVDTGLVSTLAPAATGS